MGEKNGETGLRAGPLTGIHVLDLSRVLAGPLGTMILGDLGADIIKVERPGSGDDTRAWGPPFLAGDAGYFLGLNRNKRSIALDLNSPDGRRIAIKAADRSDVLVENFRPGLAAKFGLDYESLRARNPRLVYCSITAFGPESDRPGYDVVMQALSGLMSVTGPRNGEPTKVGVALIDVITGLYAAVGIQAALRQRDQTARGQKVEISLFDAALAALVNQATNYLLGGLIPEPLGNDHPHIVPYGSFSASDRFFVVAAGNDSLFARTCKAMGRPELATSEAFASNASRVQHRDQLSGIMNGIFRKDSAEHWIERLQMEGVPCAPIRTMDEVFQSPEAVGALEEIDDAVHGPLRLVRSPIHLSASGPPRSSPPPALDADGNEIRSELSEMPGFP